MPNYTTLLDVIKSNAANGTGIPMIDEVSRRTPFMANAAFRKIPGLNYKTLVQTGASNTTGSFRKMNQGIAAATTTEELREFECFPIQPRLEVDKQVADKSLDGAAAFIARKLKGILLTEFIAHEKQMFYGAGSGLGNSLGYPGLLDAYDSVNFVTDAGGTTANTGSSVWMVEFGPEAVQGIMGNEGLFEFGPLRIESIIDTTSVAGASAGTSQLTKFDAYVQSLLASVGLQVTNVRRVARIKKLTQDAGCTLTDKLLYDTLVKFDQMGPNAIFMSLRSIGQLRDSRTATNPTGQAAPFPTSILGIDGQEIPIYPTVGISTNESLTL